MAAIDDLTKLLNDDIRDLDQLNDTLTAEKMALRGSDINAIEPLTQVKNSLLNRIRDRARQKVHALVAMGYRPETGAPSQFIRSAGLTDLTNLWQTAEKKLAQCHELNGLNGRIIAHLQKRLASLTDIFRGSSGQAKLYGASGQQTSLGQRNILASA